MSKRGRVRAKSPEQLHLQLEYDYLQQLLATSEESALYEATARTFLGEALFATEKNPVWEELNRMFC